MLDDDDLDAAVEAGLVTQAQADQLRTFAVQRRKFGAAERADEERFRFMRGFNDFFFAVGVVLLGSGLSMFAGMYTSPIAYGLAAVVMWALAELLVRRMRLVLPGIVIVIFFVVFAVSALPIADLFVGVQVAPRGMPRNFLAMLYIGGSLPLAIKSAVVALAAAAFYARFRFPFALLIVAGGAVAAFASAVKYFLFNDASRPGLLILLLCGLVVFAFAMRFDLSDRLRATRRSDCAFWLHVLAAPLLVHSLVGLVTDNAYVAKLNAFTAIMIIVIALIFTVVALIIDRRALLVSALAYVGSAIAYALSTAAVTGALVLITTLIILGALVLALGVGWAPLRRRVVSLLSPKIADRLPPVVPA